MLERDTLERIIELGEAGTLELNGQTYSTKKLYPVNEPTVSAINVRSLSGLVEYIKSSFDTGEPLMVHVKNATEVVAFTTTNNDLERDVYIKAKAMLPEFTFDRFYDSETFNIKMQSCFVTNADKDIILKVVGNIKEENVNQTGDDGVSQSVVIKTGVAAVGQVKVPNPVQLMPFRTFVEVEQPTSDFVFRMQDGPRCALFEADGGAWELEAMENIQNYLSTSLKGEIEAGIVVVIA